MAWFLVVSMRLQVHYHSARELKTVERFGVPAVSSAYRAMRPASLSGSVVFAALGMVDGMLVFNSNRPSLS